MGPLSAGRTGASKPKTSQLSKDVTTGAGALGGAFWGISVWLAVLYPVLWSGGGCRDWSLDGALCELWDRPELHRPGARQGHPRHFGFIPVVDWGSSMTVLLRPSKASSLRSFRPTCPKSKKTSCALTLENRVANIACLHFGNEMF